MQLKKLADSTTGVVHHLFEATFSPSAQHRYNHHSEALTFLRFCQSSVNHDLTRSITTFICDHGKQQFAMVDMHKVVKSLIEINQEVVSECKEKLSHAKLFPLFYDYYRIIHGTSQLYDDFLRLLKDAFDNWLSVKIALEQILAKTRTDSDYSYREMLEQLNDLETSEGIRFCDIFITKFAYFCKQAFAFSIHIKKFESVNTLAKVSSVTIAGIFSILFTYMCADKLSQEMKGADSDSMWLHLIHSLLNKHAQWFPGKGSYGRELKILEFLDCATVVQELKMKMARFASFTRQNEKEMVFVINKLEKMTDNISVTIEDMHRDAHLYSLDIRGVGIALNQFIAGSNLQLSVTGVRFMPHREEQQSVSKAMAIMYRATLSLIHTGVQWYMCACEDKEADSSRLLSCHSSIHDNTTSIINVFSRPYYPASLDGFHKLITCLHAINQEGFTVLSECKEEWRHHPQLFYLVNEYHTICLQTARLYNDFVRLLKGQRDSGLGEILRLREVVVNCRLAGYYPNSELDLDDNDDGCFTLSGDFMKSLADICQQTVGFTRQFNEEILELKSVKVLAKISSGLIAGVFSVMTAYMVDPRPFLWMEEKPLMCLWLHLNRCFSWKSPRRKLRGMVKNDILGIGSRLSKVKDSIKCFLCEVMYQSEEYLIENKWNVMREIDPAAKKIDEMSVTIEKMSRHADTLNGDIVKAGISLELTSHNHTLPVKRKR